MTDKIVQSIINYINIKEKEASIKLNYRTYKHSKILSASLNGVYIDNPSFMHIIIVMYDFINNKEDILKNTTLSYLNINSNKLESYRQYYLKKIDLYIRYYIRPHQAINEIITLKEILNIDIKIKIKLYNGTIYYI